MSEYREARSQAKARVLLVDGKSTIDRWRGILCEDFDVELACSVDEAMAAIAPEAWEKCPFEAVVTELVLSDGYGGDVAVAALQRVPRAGVSVLSDSVTPERELDFQSRGIRVLHRPVPAETLRTLVEMLVCAVDPHVDLLVADAALSQRESQLVRLHAAGHPDGKIAELMRCAPNTLKTLWRRVLRKTGLGSRREVLAVSLNGRGLSLRS